MSRAAGLLQALSPVRLGRRAALREIDEEIAFHLEEEERLLHARGVPREEARSRALAAFGSIETVRLACLRERWSGTQVCVVAVLALALVAGLVPLLLALLPHVVVAVGPIHGGGGFPKTAPFTDVRWTEGRTQAEVEGRWVELHAIDGTPVAEIEGFARRAYGERLWQKRMAEDLVEVLVLSGAPPGRTVALDVTDLETGQRKVLAEVPLTAANRREVMRSRHGGSPAAATPRGNPGGWSRRAPYTDLRVAGDRTLAEVDGRWVELTAIDGVPMKDVLAHARSAHGRLWDKRVAEDLVEVMAGLGHPIGETVDLGIRHDDGSAETLRGVTVTSAKRQALMRSRHGGPSTGATPRANPGGWSRRAPYTDLRFAGDRTLAEVDGRWVELTAIDGVPMKDVLAHARSAHGRLWDKRVAEDLVEVMAGLGHPIGETVDLGIRHDDGSAETLRGVTVTSAKRQALMPSRHRGRLTAAAPPVAGPLTRSDALADLDQLQRELEDAHAYLGLRGVDHRALLDALRAGLPETVDRGDLARRVNALIARLGDGHAGVRGVRDTMDGSFLPFLLADTSAGTVGIIPDRSGFLDPERPIVVGLDAVPLERWVRAAAHHVPDGSPQLERFRALRLVRQLDHFRGELGLEVRPTVTVHVQGAGGGPVRDLELPVATARPTYGPWPRTATRLLPGEVGYLRLASMRGGPELAAEIDAAMTAFRNTRGLVVDVRGNGGGRRDAIRALAPYLLAPDDPPLVVNVAAYRLPPGTARGRPEGYLQDRYLFPAAWDGWTDAQRAAIGAFAETFRPEWRPRPEAFSAWHYMVVDQATNPEAFRYDRPVVVLLDEGCFSATDIFLGALSQLEGVTLVGTPSSGGSARSRGVVLRRSGLRLRLATMASFRPDGRLYDGWGIAPDVLVLPAPSDLLGTTDAVLDEALRTLAGDG